MIDYSSNLIMKVYLELGRGEIEKEEFKDVLIERIINDEIISEEEKERLKKLVEGCEEEGMLFMSVKLK